MEEMEKTKTQGVGLPFILFTVFLTLKLTNNIDWSWWWVTSPIWIPIAFVVTIVIVIVFFYTIHQIFKQK